MAVTALILSILAVAAVLGAVRFSPARRATPPADECAPLLARVDRLAGLGRFEDAAVLDFFTRSTGNILAAANAVVNSRLDDYPDDSLRDRKETNISLPCLTGCLRF